HCDPFRTRVRAEHRVRVMVYAREQPVDLGRGYPGRIRAAGHRTSVPESESASATESGRAADMAASESSGIDSQDGRFLASYITSYTALSSSKARSSTSCLRGSMAPPTSPYAAQKASR